jgi:flagellar biosynthesis anti-sigma factor FlgM
MRVDLYTGKLAGAEGSKAERSARRETSATGEASRQDTATITFDQLKVQGLEASVMAQPDMRDAKVLSIRQTIGKGEYAVTGDRLADAILNELTRTGEP